MLWDMTSVVRSRPLHKDESVPFDLGVIEDGIKSGKRAALGRAITLLESKNPEHRKRAEELLARLMPLSGKAQRVGITGVPGVGKSTFIEALGLYLVEQGHRVAVLAVDPSSGRTGGSILGDKTRMEKLSSHPAAFIRPSPSSGVLGGVAGATMEAIIAVEAAGYDVVLVETVGTGQSETMVADMVDFFLVLTLPGAGDDLQGIKKGVLELAHMIAVNKADVFKDKLTMALRDYQAALHILKDISPDWHPPVLGVSGLTGEGVAQLWQRVEQHRKITIDSGEREERRAVQREAWFQRLLGEALLNQLLAAGGKAAQLRDDLAVRVKAGELSPTSAVHRLLAEIIG